MKKLITRGICLIMILCIALPVVAFAAPKKNKTVRVGWYESTYCYHDQNGERRGIAYEYQSRIAAHTGWKYEYVEDSWPNLLQMLMDGEIDLLSDVSYKEERTEHMLYPNLAMGAESYYLYIDADNTTINPEELQTLNGRRIGVNKDSFQEGLLKDWLVKNGITARIVELTGDESYTMEQLNRGELDAIVTMNSFGAQERVVPVTKIGDSEYFLAVNKDRPDLLAELNTAMAAVQDEDPYFNQRMFDQYVNLVKTNAFLLPSLEDWLEGHGAVRVGYLADNLPFCAADPNTRALTGALKDFLAHASNCLKNAEITFEAVPYVSTGAALEAMQNGDVDCVFPINLSTYAGETMGVFTTSSIMKTEMSLLMRAADRPEIRPGTALTVAIDQGNTNYETLVKESFPSWIIRNYPDEEACFRAVSLGDADGVLVSLYRMNEYESLREKYKLTAVPTGEALGLCFAVSTSQPELYAILNKITNMSASEDMEYALAAYMSNGQKPSVMELLRDNRMYVVAVLAVVFAVILVLLYQKLKAERRANEQQRLLEEAAEIAELKQTITSLLDNMPGINYTKDAQTGEYLACNQAFARYARKKTPEDVVGLTAADIFDAKSAAQYAQDDKITLSMDGPYIFFEEAVDAAGEPMQVKTTKLKYTDANGRLCILGISQEVTDNLRFRRDSSTTKESYETARANNIIFAHIAQALAQGYEELYYINLDTEAYIQYSIDDASGTLSEVRRGWHFFEQCQLEAEEHVYPEDREEVLHSLDRTNLVAELEQNDTFIMTYRLMGEDEPTYVSMRITRMQDDRYIILGVTDVNEQMQQRDLAARAQEEQAAYDRISALAGDFLCVFLVDPETGSYREFKATAGFASFARPSEGADFFADCRESADAVFPDDQNLYKTMMTRETVMADVEKHGIFTLSYRLMMEGRPRYVQFKAVMVEEEDGPQLVVGVNDIDTQVRQEEAYVKNLAQARIEASVDPLTGVKNRHAYLMSEERLNNQIAENLNQEFAIVVLDVNDLKKVNDTQGHEAGDRHIKGACKIICETFGHSPVFRIGGDEFAVIAQGGDYGRIDELMEQMQQYNLEAQENGGIVIACGMARHGDEDSVAPVFERADQNMYFSKSDLKARKDG